MDSLVDAQIHQLTAARARLFKQATLNGETDTVRYVPGDTLAWTKELDAFRKLEVINKPVNKSNYRIRDKMLDPGSNLTVKAFESIKDVPVIFLKIYYQDSPEKPRKIEALYRESNILYHSMRHLSMDFQQIEGVTVLTGYEVRGGQKMVMGDSVEFQVRGKVLVD